MASLQRAECSLLANGRCWALGCPDVSFHGEFGRVTGPSLDIGNPALTDRHSEREFTDGVRSKRISNPG
jgi:hypothetical protein